MSVHYEALEQAPTYHDASLPIIFAGRSKFRLDRATRIESDDPKSAVCHLATEKGKTLGLAKVETDDYSDKKIRLNLSLCNSQAWKGLPLWDKA